MGKFVPSPSPINKSGNKPQVENYRGVAVQWTCQKKLIQLDSTITWTPKYFKGQRQLILIGCGLMLQFIVIQSIPIAFTFFEY